MKQVSIVRCGSYANEEVRKALVKSLKDIDSNFKEGMKVLIKPNILGEFPPERAITTHPIVIEELCKILKEKGCEIYIGDSSGGDTRKAFGVSGIKKLSKYGKVLNFEGVEKKFFNIAGERIPFPKVLFDVDLVINVAKLKTHVFTKVTLCAKNLYGCVPGELKGVLHRKYPSEEKLSEIIFGIVGIVKPELNIVDGIEGIEGNGPGTAGLKKHAGVLIVGEDVFATDIIASELMGFEYYDILTNKMSKIKKDEIQVVGDGKDIKVKFKKPMVKTPGYISFFWRLFPKAKICFNYANCIKCGVCEEKCPVNAIELKPYPKCNHDKCIRCLCCIEVCPHNAVCIKENKVKEWMKKVKRKIFRRKN